MKRLLALVALIFLCGSYRPASAATCSISATNIVFGTYTGATTINVTGTLTVNCSANAAYYITLNAGLNSGGNVSNRKMIGPNSVLLGYGLYIDTGHTVNWGNTSGSNSVTGTGNGHAQTVTIYAQLPSNQYAPGGENNNFSDTIQAAIVSPTGLFTTATVNFNISAKGSSSCAISAGPLAFPNYTGSLINATSTISVTCTSGTPYNVGLNAGTATGATVTKRSMTGPAGVLLSYKLFSNSAYTVNWGNTVGTDTVAGSGTGLAKSLTVYGQIPGAQSAPLGNYTDTIIATITY